MNADERVARAVKLIEWVLARYDCLFVSEYTEDSEVHVVPVEECSDEPRYKLHSV